MADIGRRSGKLRAGLYRYGRFKIIREGRVWFVYSWSGSRLDETFTTQTDAWMWCRGMQRLENEAAA